MVNYNIFIGNFFQTLFKEIMEQNEIHCQHIYSVTTYVAASDRTLTAQQTHNQRPHSTPNQRNQQRPTNAQPTLNQPYPTLSNRTSVLVLTSTCRRYVR